MGANDGNSLQYTGRENDSTGLYYNRARYYDPQLKRFVSSDPIGLRGGVNVYAYVHGSPLSYRDSYGNCPWCVGALIGGTIGGIYGAIQAGNQFGWSWDNFADIAGGAAIGALEGGLTGATGGISGGFWTATLVGGAVGAADEGFVHNGNACQIIGHGVAGALGGAGGWAWGFGSALGAVENGASGQTANIIGNIVGDTAGGLNSLF